jgi:hypothetical protein
MESDNVKTPSQLAGEVKQTAHDALQAAQGYAQESGRIGRDAVQSIRSNVEDAKEVGLQAAGTVAGLSNDAKDIARDAAQTGKVYAKDAVNATGRKIRDFRGQVNHARESCVQYVADQPVRASLIAMAAGAVVTSLLLSTMRGRRRNR